MVSVNCTSPKSKPSATLRWHINETPIDAAKMASEYETIFSTQADTEGLEISSLALKFILTDKHFNHGILRLRCTASIGMMYNMRNEVLIASETQDELENTLSKSGLRVSENLSQGKSLVTFSFYFSLSLSLSLSL